MSVVIYRAGRNFSCYISSIPFGYILPLVESTSKAFRILTNVTFSHVLCRITKNPQEGIFNAPLGRGCSNLCQGQIISANV